MLSCFNPMHEFSETWFVIVLHALKLFLEEVFNVLLLLVLELLLYEVVLLFMIAIVLYLGEYFKLFLNMTGGLRTINTLSMLLMSGWFGMSNSRIGNELIT